MHHDDGLKFYTHIKNYMNIKSSSNLCCKIMIIKFYGIRKLVLRAIFAWIFALWKAVARQEVIFTHRSWCLFCSIFRALSIGIISFWIWALWFLRFAWGFGPNFNAQNEQFGHRLKKISRWPEIRITLNCRKLKKSESGGVFRAETGYVTDYLDNEILLFQSLKIPPQLVFLI